MKGRANVKLLCNSQADAESVRADVQAWLDGRADRWQVEGFDPVAAFDPPRGLWAVSADVAFTAPDGADALLSRVQTRWNSGPVSGRILAGSSVTLHDCSHDVGVGQCSPRTGSVKA